MSVNLIKKSLPYAIGLFPLVVAAQGNLQGIAGTITGLLNLAVGLIIGVAIIVFMWGLVQYIGSTGDEEKRAGARQTMIWGVIVIAVMVALYGLIGVLLSTFNLSGGGTITPPVIR